MSKETNPSTEELFKAEMPGLEFNDGDTEQKNKLRNSKNLFYDARFHSVEYGTKEFETTLNMPGDFYEFTIEVENTGDFDALLDSITISSLSDAQAKYLSHKVTYGTNEYTTTTTGLSNLLEKSVSNEAFRLLKYSIVSLIKGKFINGSPP